MIYDLRKSVKNSSGLKAWRAALVCFFSFLTILLFLLTEIAAAKTNLQRIRFHTYNIEDGLSQSTVLSLAQDSLGYTWIGTQDGLNRFDGVENTIFRHSPTNSETINSPTISNLIFDDQRTLWILTPQGLDSIDIHTLKVTHWTDSLQNLQVDGPNVQGQAKEVWSISLNQDKTLSVLGADYFATIDVTNKTVNQNQRLSDFIEGKSLQVMTIIGQRIFFIHNNCVLQVDFGGGQRKEFCSQSRSIEKFDNFFSFDEYPDTVFISHSSGFSTFKLSTGEFQHYDVIDSKVEAPVEVEALLPDGEGIWVATTVGLKFWDNNQGKVAREYHADFSDKHSIASDYTMSLMRGFDGLIWLGTGLGVNYWDSREQFVHLLQKSEVAPFGRDNISTTLYKDYLGKLWVGTEASGVYQYDETLSKLNHFSSLPTEQGPMTTGYVADILEDTDRNLWLLTGTGMFIRPYQSATFYYLTEFVDVDGNVVKLTDLGSVIEGRNGQIWLGGKQGFFKVSINTPPGEKLSTEHIVIEDLTERLPINFVQSKYGVYTMYEDLQGYIWLGGSRGLIRFSPLTFDIQYYLSDPNDPETLSSSDINVIYEDLLGVLWVGTVTGLNRIRYNINGEVYFQRITVNDGFINDFICSVLSDDSGNLWVSTANGLVKFHPDKGRPINYTYSDGLQYSEFFTNAHFADNDGYLYFGGLNGISYFNPEDIIIDKEHQPIKITEVIQKNIRQPLDGNESNNLYRSTIQYGDITDIKFTVFNYVNAKNLEFRYRIEGLTPDWINLGNSRLIRLHSVEQEVLNIRIQVRYEDSDWSGKESQLRINVDKGFWRSTKGFAVYFFVLSLFVIAVVFYIYRGIKKTLKLKERLLKESESKSQMLLKDKKSLLYRVEDLQYSLSEQRYQVELLTSKLEQSSMDDQLTGFRTRSYLKGSIQKELESILTTWRDKRELQGVYLGVFAVDIDNLATINQRYGQICGNEIIKQLADCLRTICYGTDTLVRWQGATLVILSRGIEKREQMLLAEKIRNIVASRKFDLGNGSTTDVTCSIGFTRFPFTDNIERPLTWEQIIYITEKALAVAKKNSRNAWIGIYANQFTRGAELDSKLASDLPALIVSGQLDYVSSIPKSKKLLWM
ncbi:diguanylate cyclase with beta propeller sensor [Kangiella koreensis DSM 16069]|uniref:Diguanylate cyclase with beta propeller sensor n=1 Tax=Kangiella koreensis (strain DSM 16069 / JCM 12317 / KCTC 12182 / SW-125) TaxID=523791 RepID=C7RC98_KANKD|nr:diguanylate cyclase with beta propeller sensor [Kangiella koreensis DSM 16069]